MSDDVSDWIEETAKRLKQTEASSNSVWLAEAAKDLMSDEDQNVKAGTPTQYSLYGEGYICTTPTVRTLSPGCYEIASDSKAIFVIPMPPPAGLLLELPEMHSNEVLKIVDTFWKSEADYKTGNEFVVGGATYKAGIMVYGPPGTGKSCTLKLVANKLIEKGGIIFYSSANPHSTIRWLTNFAAIEPDRKSIVVLEDIDSLIEMYGETPYLEMLDSAKTVNNVLFVATTNYPGRLDPRIYNRPGRFSHIVKVGYPGEKAREAYLKAILKNHRDVEAIVKQTSGFTIDHLTALVNAVYREKKDLDKELSRLRRLFNVPTVEDKNISLGIGKIDDV